jgi:hypothetical protein
MRVNIIDQPFLLCTLRLNSKSKRTFYPVILIDDSNSKIYVMVKELRLTSDNKYGVVL